MIQGSWQSSFSISQKGWIDSNRGRGAGWSIRPHLCGHWAGQCKYAYGNHSPHLWCPSYYPDEILTKTDISLSARHEETLARLNACSPKDKDTAFQLLDVFLKSLWQTTNAGGLLLYSVIWQISCHIYELGEEARLCSFASFFLRLCQLNRP